MCCHLQQWPWLPAANALGPHHLVQLCHVHSALRQRALDPVAQLHRHGVVQAAVSLQHQRLHLVRAAVAVDDRPGALLPARPAGGPSTMPSQSVTHAFLHSPA